MVKGVWPLMQNFWDQKLHVSANFIPDTREGSVFFGDELVEQKWPILSSPWESAMSSARFIN